MTDILAARAGEGAGDQLLALNNAHGWAHYYNVDVELEYHWSVSEDFRYVETDPETVAERVGNMHLKLRGSSRVNVEHIYESDIFERYLAKDFDHSELIKPKKWFWPDVGHNGIIHCERSPFGLMSGNAEWEFEESPTTTKKIVYWDWSKNRESPQEFKDAYLDWEEILEKAQKLFPNHEFVQLTYRDSFEKAYQEIKDCEFCLGYDGMWHIVARNFGKLFVCPTGNTRFGQVHTNPSGSLFTSVQFYEYLEKISEPSYLEKEQRVTETYHQRRMVFYP